MKDRNGQGTKYRIGYTQGMLAVQGRYKILESGNYQYMVWCAGCQDIRLMTITELSKGKLHCGCQETDQVYFIRLCINDEYDYMKIGRTNGDVYNRLAVAQTHSPIQLKLQRLLSGSKHHEKLLHEHFDKYHVLGEWFKFTPEMMTIIPEGATEIVDIGNPKDLGL